jgi:hypothetical protein
LPCAEPPCSAYKRGYQRPAAAHPHHILKLTEPQSLREFHFPQSQRRDYYYRLPSSISVFTALYFDCTRGEQLQLVMSHSTYTDFFLPSLVGLALSRPCRHRPSPMRATTTTAPTLLSVQNGFSTNPGAFSQLQYPSTAPPQPPHRLPSANCRRLENRGAFPCCSSILN